MSSKTVYELPLLYELSTAGRVKTWSIAVFDRGETSDMVTRFGVLGGKIQETTDTIRGGKNEGRANETTAYEQAQSEAASKWEKKKKKGYVESIEGAEAGELDTALILGGVVPMLAETYAKKADKIVFPAFIQPKLDGMRCIAIKNGDDVTLWSRSRKPIDTCAHIVAAIKVHYEDQDVILDGELYSHDLSDAFGKIMSSARGDSAENPSSNLQYHIYDTVAEGSFAQRWRALDKEFPIDGALRAVQTYGVEDDAEMRDLFKLFLEDGYEGLIIRNADAPYQNRRTPDLQKVKTFDDAEFLIIGVKEGRGRLQGTLGTFTCQTSDGTVFDAKMTGNQEDNGKYLTDSTLWTGKMLTVQYQGLTDKNNVPRFPVGLRIREAE